jgi:thiol-disulfide isomerase/thioredoxin
LVVSGLVDRRDPAPELQGTGGWLNSEPFTLRSREGSVVLVDFWTYSCVNCIRTLPYLRSWHEKYADRGLVVLGVHSPEFEFEKVPENVATAVKDLGIAYAVVQDNEFKTWHAFDNQFWPAKYLIDKDGNIRYVRHGEGAYDETEDKIRELLVEAGFDVSDVPPHTEPSPTIDPGIKFIQDPAAGLTRELYAGFSRNQAAVQELLRPWVLHSEFYSGPNSDVLYKDPEGHRSGYLYLEGLWRNQPESLVHARATDAYTDYVTLRFYGTSANSVMAPGPTGQSTVRLTIDGAPVPAEWAGADVLFDPSGNSYLLVDEARMYRLIELPLYGGHELRLATDAPGLKFFAFTFGSYESGP